MRAVSYLIMTIKPVVFSELFSIIHGFTLTTVNKYSLVRIELCQFYSASPQR